MDAKIKTDWVKALTSGYYKQTTGCLFNADEDTFCCLGVLTDLAVKAGVFDWNTLPEDGSGQVGLGDVLPKRVQEWAGLDDGKGDNPEVELPCDHRNCLPGDNCSGVLVMDLATLNDNGESFGVIAELIGEQL